MIRETSLKQYLLQAVESHKMPSAAHHITESSGSVCAYAEIGRDATATATDQEKDGKRSPLA